MLAAPTCCYEFGNFRLDAAKRRLTRTDGSAVPLTPRVFDTLAYIVEHHATVLDKEQIMEAVWPDSIVEENNLTQNISTLRRVLGETRAAHRFIVTVPGRGYRFVADVKALDEALDTRVDQLAPHENDSSRASYPLTPSSTEQRPKSQDFTRAAALVTLLLIVMGACAFLYRNYDRIQRVESKSPPEKSIAVLPFGNLSDDPESASFAAGVQEEILSDLASIADLKVTSRTSANFYQNTHPRNSREIGQQLGVRHLLEGSVQRIGDHLRVHAQLIDAKTDSHVWAQTYDRDIADLFAVQREIAQAIATQLQAKISVREKAAMDQPPTSDVVANALYLEALDMQRAPLQAIPLLERAIARDREFVRAFCLEVKFHLFAFTGGEDHTDSRRDLAKGALDQAVRLRPYAGEVHLAAAQYAYWGFLDYTAARAELELARRSLPNSAEVYLLTAQIDRKQGRWDEALRNFDRALELDPRNGPVIGNTAGCYEYLRRYEDARRLFNRLALLDGDGYGRIGDAQQTFFQKGDIRPLHDALSQRPANDQTLPQELAEFRFLCAEIERDPAELSRAVALIPHAGLGGNENATYPHEWFAGIAARALGDEAAALAAFSAAREHADEAVHRLPEYAGAWSVLGRIDAALGRKDDAMREGRHAVELLPMSKDAVAGSRLIISLASIYAAVGEKDLALEQLALSARNSAGVHYGELKLNPEWDSLRGDVRFSEIANSLAPRSSGDSLL